MGNELKNERQLDEQLMNKQATKTTKESSNWRLVHECLNGSEATQPGRKHGVAVSKSGTPAVMPRSSRTVTWEAYTQVVKVTKCGFRKNSTHSKRKDLLHCTRLPLKTNTQRCSNIKMYDQTALEQWI
eukprot:4032402-Amphidinium_carterae.1